MTIYMTTLILADDDPIVCHGLAMIIEAHAGLSLLGSGASGREAVELCRAHRPDVALLDIRMPAMDGLEAARVIIAEGLAVPLMLTTFDEPELVARALELGVGGYILKNSPAQRITASIITAAQGGTVFQRDILNCIRSTAALPPCDDVFRALTQREIEVAALVAEGLSNAEIAERLFLSGGTVRNHISVILEKTGLQHRTQIAIRYLRR